MVDDHLSQVVSHPAFSNSRPESAVGNCDIPPHDLPDDDDESDVDSTGEFEEYSKQEGIPGQYESRCMISGDCSSFIDSL